MNNCSAADIICSANRVIQTSGDMFDGCRYQSKTLMIFTVVFNEYIYIFFFTMMYSSVTKMHAEYNGSKVHSAVVCS